MKTNSWVATIVLWAVAALMLLLWGWGALVAYLAGATIAGCGMAYNLLRADAIRPRGEFSNTPIPPRDWVL